MVRHDARAAAHQRQYTRDHGMTGLVNGGMARIVERLIV
jgi:hypothetical protein